MKYLNVKALSVLIIAACCFVFTANAQTAKPKAKPAAPAKSTKAKTTVTTGTVTDTTKAAATTATPAAPATPKTAPGIIEAFFKKYKDDGTSAAIDYLFGTNKYFTNPAGILQLKAKLDSLRQGIGTYLGRDLIVQKTASNSLIFYSYLVKHEIQPIRFTFIFYKPQNEWVLYRFKYDDQMDAELEEAGRINNKHQ
ncbi:MAG: hypothetical protein V4577_31160 [Bacteroidota bacterium]